MGKLCNGKYIAIRSNNGAFKLLQVSVAYFLSEELWRLPRNNELRYRTRINSDFVRFKSEFFQRHSHMLAQVAHVRKRYVCLVSCTGITREFNY